MGVVAAGRAAGIVTDDDELAVGEDDQVGEIDFAHSHCVTQP